MSSYFIYTSHDRNAHKKYEFTLATSLEDFSMEILFWVI